jgi:hypothetical protein
MTWCFGCGYIRRRFGGSYDYWLRKAIAMAAHQVPPKITRRPMRLNIGATLKYMNDDNEEWPRRFGGFTGSLRDAKVNKRKKSLTKMRAGL